MTCAGNQNLVIIQSWGGSLAQETLSLSLAPSASPSTGFIRRQTQVHKTMSSEDFENGKAFMQILGSRGDIL